MLRSVKRVIPTMFVLSLLLSICLMPVEAKQEVESDGAEQMRFSYIDYFRKSFSISSSGKTIIVSVVRSNDADEMKIVGLLQKYVNGSWKTIKVWSSEGSGATVALSKNWYVSSGYSYRYKSYSYMYVNGSMVESTSYTSSNEYY